MQAEFGIEGLNCRLVLGTGFLSLVIAYFDNGGFSRVVTLNSPGGVLPLLFSPFVNKSPVSNLFSAAFNLVDSKFEKMDDQDDIHTAYEKLYKVSEKYEKLYRLATKKLSDA